MNLPCPSHCTFSSFNVLGLTVVVFFPLIPNCLDAFLSTRSMFINKKKKRSKFDFCILNWYFVRHFLLLCKVFFYFFALVRKKMNSAEKGRLIMLNVDVQSIDVFYGFYYSFCFGMRWGDVFFYSFPLLVNSLGCIV